MIKDVIHIPDLFGFVTSKISAKFGARPSDPFTVRFDYGTQTEIFRKLTEMTMAKDPTKYPFVWLLVPFKESFDDKLGYYCSLPDISLFVVEYSQNTLTSQQRKLQTFVPRLYPIYQEYVNQLQSLYYFSAGSMKHEKIDFPYYDSRDGKQTNIFPDYTDVIQISIKNLLVNETVCVDFKMKAA